LKGNSKNSRFVFENKKIWKQDGQKSGASGAAAESYPGVLIFFFFNHLSI